MQTRKEKLEKKYPNATKYDLQEMDEKKGRVACDDLCGALENPKTLTQALKTLEHYKSHSYLSGCSHAN